MISYVRSSLNNVKCTGIGKQVSFETFYWQFISKFIAGTLVRYSKKNQYLKIFSQLDPVLHWVNAL